MVNAKQELQEYLKNRAFSSKIICADITYEHLNCKESFIRLHKNYSERDLNDFFDKLDFVYDNGFGWQELYGVVWLENGAWLERQEYDGSEYWVFKETPLIPEYLNDNHWELV